MDVVSGNNVVVYRVIDGVEYEIGCADSCSFSLVNEIIGKTTVGGSGFRAKRVRMSDWSGTVSGVVKTSNENDVLGPFYFLQEGVRRTEGDYVFKFVDDDGNIKRIECTAIIEEIPLSATIGDYATWDLNLTGTGGFEVSVLSSPTVESADQVDSDWWSTTPGQTYINGSSYNAKSLVGKEVLEVWREGQQYDLVTGTPSGRQCKFTSGTGRVDFDTALPFNSGETVFVIWVY